MTWWELRKLTIAVLLIDAAALAACTAVCVAIGAFDRAGVGTAAFIVAFVLILVGAAAEGAGGAWMRSASTPSRMEDEYVATHRARHATEEIAAVTAMSGMLVYGIAGLSLIGASAAILLI